MKSAETSEVARAERLYEAGDYREARRLAESALASGRSSAEERTRLMAVLRATGTDWAVVAALLGTLSLLVFLVIKYGF